MKIYFATLNWSGRCLRNTQNIHLCLTSLVANFVLKRCFFWIDAVFCSSRSTGGERENSSNFIRLRKKILHLNYSPVFLQISEPTSPDTCARIIIMLSPPRRLWPISGEPPHTPTGVRNRPSDVLSRARFHGDAEQARSVLHQAVQSAAADDGSAESACFYLLRFEREHGSLADLDDAVRKTDARLAKVAKRKDKVCAARVLCPPVSGKQGSAEAVSGRRGDAACNRFADKRGAEHLNAEKGSRLYYLTYSTTNARLK